MDLFVFFLEKKVRYGAVEEAVAVVQEVAFVAAVVWMPTNDVLKEEVAEVEAL